MSENIKISVIVPVYNDEKHLRFCLDSLVGQSMREIEIICIDDASTDGSGEILKEYAEADNRICVISYAQNCSASQARKDGCLKSRGEYILFVDGDDYLLPRACEKLYLEMLREPVDILHFGTYVLNYSYVPQSRIREGERFVAPLQERLEGEAVFEEAFRKRRYMFNIWNKCYHADACKKAMRQIEDGSFPKAQDKYAFFAIALEAKSYRGIENRYYVYRFGSGITGHESMNLGRFQKYCTMGKTADAMGRLLEKRGLSEKYADVQAINRKQLLEDVAMNWLRLPEKDREKGLEIVGQFWKEEEVRYVREKKVG